MATSSEAPTNERKPTRRSTVALWSSFALLFLLIGFAVFGDRGIVRAYHVYHQKLALEGQIHQLQLESRTLREEIAQLKVKDGPYIEHVARTELGMVRDNELIYQFKQAQ